MDWDKIMRFASYYGLQFMFGYDDEHVSITLKYRDEHVFYEKTRYVSKNIFNKLTQNGKAETIHDLMTNLAKDFETDGRKNGLI